MTMQEFIQTSNLEVAYNQAIPPLIHCIIAYQMINRLPPKEKTPKYASEHAIPRYFRIVIKGGIGKWEIVELYGIRRFGGKTAWDYFDGYWNFK